MHSGHEHLQVNIPNHVNWSVNSWEESVRLTMVKQESVFKYQLEELHRIYKKQIELMEELKGTVNGQLTYSRKRSKKPKFNLEEKMVNLNEVTGFDFQVGRDTDAPKTPETTNSFMARGKQLVREDVHARSAAETLVAMSSSNLNASSDRLLAFAKIVTSVKRDADLASVQRKARLGQKPGQQRAQEMGMPGQHKGQTAKKRKGTNVEKCICSWGRIKNGRRSKRVRDSNALYTFQRGAFLCRWR